MLHFGSAWCKFYYTAEQKQSSSWCGPVRNVIHQYSHKVPQTLISYPNFFDFSWKSEQNEEHDVSNIDFPPLLLLFCLTTLCLGCLLVRPATHTAVKHPDMQDGYGFRRSAPDSYAATHAVLTRTRAGSVGLFRIRRPRLCLKLKRAVSKGTDSMVLNRFSSFWGWRDCGAATMFMPLIKARTGWGKDIYCRYNKLPYLTSRFTSFTQTK